MSETESSSYQRSFGDDFVLKITKNKEQNNETQLLVVEKAGKVVFESSYDGLSFKDGQANQIDISAEQLKWLIVNQTTDIQLTQNGGLWIKVNDKQVNIQIKEDHKCNKDSKAQKQQFSGEERILKLQAMIQDQAAKLTSMSVLYDTIISQQTKDISFLKQSLSASKEQVEVAKLSISSLQKQLCTLQETLNPLVIQQQQFRCFHHPYNPHSHHFTLRLLPNYLRIIKTSDNTFHNFISSLPIPSGAVTNFRIRQVRIIDGQVFIGVGTKSVFGDINSWNRDFLSYYSGDGDVCENGLYHQGGQQIQDGETVNVRVDLHSDCVSWWIGEKQLAEAKLPEQMKGKQLYLVLLMKHKGDELDLLLDE